MIKRTLDPTVIAQDGIDFDPVVWVKNPDNIALRSSADVSLFQKEKNGVFIGHWFFKSRGKRAKETAVEMLDHLFNRYPVEVILGFTPLENLGARWMARHIGFKSQGALTWNGKNLEFFILTRQQWNDKV